MCDYTLYGYVQASVHLPILFPDSGLVQATPSSVGEGHRDERGKHEGSEKESEQIGRLRFKIHREMSLVKVSRFIQGQQFQHSGVNSVCVNL